MKLRKDDIGERTCIMEYHVSSRRLNQSRLSSVNILKEMCTYYVHMKNYRFERYTISPTFIWFSC